MFRWAAAEELYPGEALAALAAVAGLEKGRSDARELPPIRPVEESTVEATLPPQMAAMVRLQLLTAARPGEVCAIRPRDIDRSDPECWIYRPGSHKTEHRGRERVIALEPMTQEVLTSWLERPGDVHCFRPRKAARMARRTGRSKFGDAYTRHSYKLAIARACDRAFPHPTIVKRRGVALTEGQAAELAAWRKSHRWHPHQLRHTRATEIRRRFDVEAAQVNLGHSKPDTTLVYAERDLARAREVMLEIG